MFLWGIGEVFFFFFFSFVFVYWKDSIKPAGDLFILEGNLVLTRPFLK